MGSSFPTRVSSAARERVARRLREAYADDRLSLQTFAHRLDLLHAAQTDEAVNALLADLPEPGPLDRAIGSLTRFAARCVARAAEAWHQATAPQLLLPARGTVVLGRSRECDCVVSETTVSRRHAILRRTSSGWELSDLGSSNGTFVNGARVTGAVLVKAGDDVWLGSARFRLAPTQAAE